MVSDQGLLQMSQAHATNANYGLRLLQGWPVVSLFYMSQAHATNANYGLRLLQGWPVAQYARWVSEAYSATVLDSFPGLLWIFLCLPYAHPDQFVWGRRRHAHVPFFDMGGNWGETGGKLGGKQNSSTEQPRTDIKLPSLAHSIHSSVSLGVSS